MRASGSSYFEDTPVDERVGRQLGRYVLCRHLGVGGMARVHLAKIEGEAGFAKLVALKTIHPHLADQKTFVDMFLDEARLASQINHRNVCSVFDFGRAGGTYYLAMEYLVGEPVSRILDVVTKDNRPDELPMLALYAARLVADAAEGLHAAHELRDESGAPLGVVHRDVSPQNLFLTFDGTIKVVDFGCAKAAQRISHTDVGILKGKVSYAAPEQMKPGLGVDRRADVWSLGVVLWEMVTLERLFARETDIASAMAVLEEAIPLASDGRPWVPQELALIIDKALRRDPKQRYATARELGRDLRGFIARSGHAIDTTELAEWMDRLFAGVHEEQLALIEEASAIVAQPTVLADTGARAPRLSFDDTRAERPHVKQKKSGGMGFALFAVVLLAAGGAGAWAYQNGKLAQFGLGPAMGASVRAPAGDEPEPVAPEPDLTPPASALVLPPPIVAPTPEEPTPEAAIDPATPPTPAPPEEHEPPPTTTVAVARSTPRPSPRPEPRTTEAAEPAEPPPPANGSVRIETSGGWSEVYEGSRHLGRTPLTVEMSAGTHVIRFLPFGDEPASSQVIRVHPGTEVAVRIAIHDSQPAPDEPSSPNGLPPGW